MSRAQRHAPSRENYRASVSHENCGFLVVYYLDPRSFERDSLLSSWPLRGCRFPALRDGGAGKQTACPRCNKTPDMTLFAHFIRERWCALPPKKCLCLSLTEPGDAARRGTSEKNPNCDLTLTKNVEREMFSLTSGSRFQLLTRTRDWVHWIGTLTFPWSARSLL